MDMCVPQPVAVGILALRCEKCGGNGKIGQRIKNDSLEYAVIPCPVCGGSGIGYCCKGERAETAIILQSANLKETKDG